MNAINPSATPSPPAVVPRVDANGALVWTAVWSIGLAAYATGPLWVGQYAYQSYKNVSMFAVALLAILVVAGVLKAWAFIGGQKDAAPWYTSGFLVALVVFWAFAPPLWFYLEYYMFDENMIAVSPKLPDKEALFKQLKAYSDLGSKIWAAAGASLGAAIAAARK